MTAAISAAAREHPEHRLQAAADHEADRRRPDHRGKAEPRRRRADAQRARPCRVKLRCVEIGADVDGADEEIRGGDMHQHLLGAGCGLHRQQAEADRSRREGHCEIGPSPDVIDGQCADERADKARHLDDQPVTKRHGEVQLVDGAEDRRQPDDQAVIDEIGAEPDHPHDQGASQIDAARTGRTATRGDPSSRPRAAPAATVALWPFVFRFRSATVRHPPRRCGRVRRASAATLEEVRAAPAQGVRAGRRYRTSIASRDAAPPKAKSGLPLRVRSETPVHTAARSGRGSWRVSAR